jgi:cell division protein FtsB
VSDQGPMDPTRAERPVGGEIPPEDPTSVLRPTTPGRVRSERTYETGPADRVPPGPPGGGVSTGLAVGAALAAALLGFLLGFLLFGADDDGDADTDEVTEQTVPGDGADEALVAERDQLAQRVAEQDAELDQLRSDLETVTAERDALQEQVDERDEAETVPAPDVVGSTLDAAQSVADENGWTLVVRDSEDPGDAEPGTVVAQEPQPGTPMSEGSAFVVDVAPEGDE